MATTKGEFIELKAEDGHRFSAYRAEPPAKVRAGVVVVQEIFGVNRHIRAVCDDFASEGYRAIAPALFDRLERSVELDYDEPGVARGRELRTSLGWNAPLMDVAAVAEALRFAGKVGVVGYCWGGSVAWLSATRLDVDCALGYYGGQIVLFKDEHPNCPVMLHFGELDSMITPEDVAQIRSAQPGVTLYTYPAGHGFNCTDRRDYHPESAQLARTRTLEFFRAHLA